MSLSPPPHCLKLQTSLVALSVVISTKSGKSTCIIIASEFLQLLLQQLQQFTVHHITAGFLHHFKGLEHLMLFNTFQDLNKCNLRHKNVITCSVLENTKYILL